MQTHVETNLAPKEHSLTAGLDIDSSVHKHRLMQWKHSLKASLLHRQWRRQEEPR